MAETSSIEWTDATWNPIAGCSLASLGCANCYAMPMALRHELMSSASGRVSPYAGLTRKVNGKAVWTGELRLVEAALTLPLRWTKPRRIFVNSMSDLFHEGVPDEWIDRVFAVMALAPQHTFQVLTKRSARMRTYFAGCAAAPPDLPLHKPWITQWHRRDGVARAMYDLGERGFRDRLGKVRSLPLPNVWLGVSAEDQRRADERVPNLLATSAAVRFVSAEPLLGPLDLSWAMGHPIEIGAGFLERGQFSPGLETLRRLDWVIVGGESGPGARPMHPDWVRQIRDTCAAAGVAFHFKQWGSWKAEIDREAEDPDWRADYSFRLNDREPHIAWLNLDGGRGFHGERFHVMRRVGKGIAGRLLDGVEQNGMPEARHG